MDWRRSTVFSLSVPLKALKRQFRCRKRYWTHTTNSYTLTKLCQSCSRAWEERRKPRGKWNWRRSVRKDWIRWKFRKSSRPLNIWNGWRCLILYPLEAAMSGWMLDVTVHGKHNLKSRNHLTRTKVLANLNLLDMDWSSSSTTSARSFLLR